MRNSPVSIGAVDKYTVDEVVAEVVKRYPEAKSGNFLEDMNKFAENVPLLAMLLIDRLQSEQPGAYLIDYKNKIIKLFIIVGVKEYTNEEFILAHLESFIDLELAFNHVKDHENVFEQLESCRGWRLRVCVISQVEERYHERGSILGLYMLLLIRFMRMRMNLTPLDPGTCIECRYYAGTPRIEFVYLPVPYLLPLYAMGTGGGCSHPQRISLAPGTCALWESVMVGNKETLH
jgi:hypothetical protein